MINVEHHETIQMTFRQATVPKRSPFTCSCFIKLIAAFRLLLLPVRLLNKGLRLSGKWMLNRWVIL